MDSDSDSSSDSSGEDERRQRQHSRKAKGGTNHKSKAIVTRPKASPGYWLSCLIPMAFACQYIRANDLLQSCTFNATTNDYTTALYSSQNKSSTYAQLTFSATGMCVESLCFFMYMSLDTHIIIKLLISFVPGLLTTSLFVYFLYYTWTYALLWGFAVTFLYQNVYIRVMRGLPCCFTFGEAAILVQGLMLFVLNFVLLLPAIFEGKLHDSDFAQLNVIMMSALFCLLIACCLLASFKACRQPLGFYPLMLVLIVAVTCLPVTKPIPIIMLFKFIVMNSTRLKIIFFCFLLVAITVFAVWFQLRNSEKASTSVRKIFHLVIVMVYIPGILYQCAFLYIASGVALAIFTVLELIRVLDMQPFASGLKAGFVAFSDEKDAGILALTPFCLLIGCSISLWIFPCPCQNPQQALLPLMSGLLSIGLGDTAASVFGSKLGKIKWKNSSRTLEGSTAFVIIIILAVGCFELTGFIDMSLTKWLVVVIATIICALMEALTDQIDNLVLPLVFYSIVSWV